MITRIAGGEAQRGVPAPCWIPKLVRGNTQIEQRASSCAVDRCLSLSLSPRLSQLSLIIIAAHYLLTANRFPLRSHPSIHPSIHPAPSLSPSSLSSNQGHPALPDHHY